MKLVKILNIEEDVAGKFRAFCENDIGSITVLKFQSSPSEEQINTAFDKFVENYETYKQKQIEDLEMQRLLLQEQLNQLYGITNE